MTASTPSAPETMTVRTKRALSALAKAEKVNEFAMALAKDDAEAVKIAEKKGFHRYTKKFVKSMQEATAFHAANPDKWIDYQCRFFVEKLPNAHEMTFAEIIRQLLDMPPAENQSSCPRLDFLVYSIRELGYAKQGVEEARKRDEKEKVEQAKRAAREAKAAAKEEADRVVELGADEILKKLDTSAFEEFKQTAVKDFYESLLSQDKAFYSVRKPNYEPSESHKQYLLSRAEKDMTEAIKAFAIDCYLNVGNVTSVDRIYIRGGRFNGDFMGEKGEFHVFTSLAGGYNIQRLHYRTYFRKVESMSLSRNRRLMIEDGVSTIWQTVNTLYDSADAEELAAAKERIYGYTVEDCLADAEEVAMNDFRNPRPLTKVEREYALKHAKEVLAEARAEADLF